VVDRFEESLVTPEYFAAIGMRLVRGRWIEAGDAADAAVINETLARRAFGGEDPIGKPMKQLGRPVRVVGVAADLKYLRMDREAEPELFRGYAENLGGRPSLFIAIRVEGDPGSVAAAARTRITAIAPMQAIHGVQTLEENLSDSIAPRRLNLLLMLGFAGISLLMAAIGIYGVVAYSVTQRTREFGIRRALGASGWRIAGSVFRYGLGPALVGIAAGLLGAMGLARWMASLIYGVEPLDVFTFAAVSLLLTAASAVACVIPAARAARIDPLLSLRVE
jgi:ABC-type antimicrobial peptide transport system permease subunit